MGVKHNSVPLPNHLITRGIPPRGPSSGTPIYKGGDLCYKSSTWLIRHAQGGTGHRYPAHAAVPPRGSPLIS